MIDDIGQRQQKNHFLLFFLGIYASFYAYMVLVDGIPPNFFEGVPQGVYVIPADDQSIIFPLEVVAGLFLYTLSLTVIVDRVSKRYQNNILIKWPKRIEIDDWPIISILAYAGFFALIYFLLIRNSIFIPEIENTRGGNIFNIPLLKGIFLILYSLLVGVTSYVYLHPIKPACFDERSRDDKIRCVDNQWRFVQFTVTTGAAILIGITVPLGFHEELEQFLRIISLWVIIGGPLVSVTLYYLYRYQYLESYRRE